MYLSLSITGLITVISSASDVTITNSVFRENVFADTTVVSHSVYLFFLARISSFVARILIMLLLGYCYVELWLRYWKFSAWWHIDD
jgi:hypothetical protein